MSALLEKCLRLFKPKFLCPVCNYRGPFKTAKIPGKLLRKHAICPECRSSERLRMQWLLWNVLENKYDTRNMKLLHFAPEETFKKRFAKNLGGYVTTDLNMPDVDINADIRKLPVADESFDVVFASHVLEHIREDIVAMQEIKRVLRPGGLAVIEVPVMSEATVEYPQANPCEYEHVRAPGRDYYHKFQNLFSTMELYDSSFFPVCYQLYVYIDLTGFPTEQSPYRKPVAGKKHPIILAVYIK